MFGLNLWLHCSCNMLFLCFTSKSILGFMWGREGDSFNVGGPIELTMKSTKGFYFGSLGNSLCILPGELTAAPFRIKLASNRKHIFPTRFVCISMFAQLVSMVS